MKRLVWGNLEATMRSLPCCIIPLSRCLNSGSAPDLWLGWAVHESPKKPESAKQPRFSMASEAARAEQFLHPQLYSIWCPDCCFLPSGI